MFKKAFKRLTGGSLTKKKPPLRPAPKKRPLSKPRAKVLTPKSPPAPKAIPPSPQKNPGKILTAEGWKRLMKSRLS